MKVRRIYISWRKGRGSRRKIIGVIERTVLTGITFRYLKEGAEKALEDGFKEYPGFPLVYDKPYKEDDLDVFGLRLLSSDRPDYSKHLKFWEAEGITDKFTLLALTQGLLPTDNFEFLGLYNADNKLKFVTDISGLSHIELSKDLVMPGDQLIYEIEANKNAYHDKAVKVFKNDLHVGYIKNIHNHVFITSPKKYNLTVKSIDQNGIIRQIFVLVESSRF